MNLKILNALVVRAPPKYRLYDFLIGLLQVKKMNIENCVADCIVGFMKWLDYPGHTTSSNLGG